MRFEFASATRIIFGPGTVHELAPLARPMGRRALVVTGRDPRRAEPLLATLPGAKISQALFQVAGEPTIDLVLQGVKCAREAGCDLVIAIGGGSVIDAAKAIAALVTNAGELLDYLEVIGKGKALEQPALPFIAVPTTAGTGAEVTRNAVLTAPAQQVKVSLRSPFMLAKLAIVDPTLTVGLPAALTASTGLDALTQLIEPFVSCRANPLTDALCRDGLERVARSLRRAVTHPADLAARQDLALASLFSGLALANAGLGAVHGFAAPIGGMFAAPHGAVCAALLPHVMKVNLRALSERESRSEILPRYEEVGRRLTGQPGATAEDGVRFIKDLCRSLEISPLRTYGIREGDGGVLCENAAQSSSMKANPLPLTRSELKEILEQAL